MTKVSLVIFTYNQEQYIEKCIDSVLAIRYSNLEIIVSDDCSTDNTFDIIENKFSNIQTNHQIILNKNEKNLGIGGHFSKVFSEIASGDYIINLGGDDLIKNDYIRFALDYFANDSELMMIDFNAEVIDENGMNKRLFRKLPFNEKIYTIQDYLKVDNILTFAPGRIFRKQLIDMYGPIFKSCPTEDSVLVLRALMLGKLLRLNKVIVYYRVYSHNSSSLINLKKINNFNIVIQYLRDFVTLINKGLLEDISTVLHNRIILELNLRENINKNRLKSYINRKISIIYYKIFSRS